MLNFTSFNSSLPLAALNFDFPIILKSRTREKEKKEEINDIDNNRIHPTAKKGDRFDPVKRAQRKPRKYECR